MNKIKSRKLWAFFAWIVITICVMIMAPEYTEIALKILGWVTGVYIGGQAAVDAMSKFRVKDE